MSDSDSKNHANWIIEDVILNPPRSISPIITFGLLRILINSENGSDVESIRESTLSNTLRIFPTKIGENILHLFGQLAQKKIKDSIVYLGTENEIKNDENPKLSFIYNKRDFYLEPILAKNLPRNATLVFGETYKVYLN